MKQKRKLFQVKKIKSNTLILLLLGLFSCSTQAPNTSDSFNFSKNYSDNFFSLANVPDLKNLKNGDVIPGQYIVKFKDNNSGAASLSAMNSGLSSMKVSKSVRGKQLLKITNPEHIKKLKTDPNVEYIEENRMIKLPEEDLVSKQKKAFKTKYAPNDLFYPSQYQHNKIGTPEAWDYTIGSNIVKVAVVDSGVALHEDLDANIIPGMSFVGASEPSDDDVGHGTHVAGIIAATANNSLGVAGVAPMVKIMPVKVLSTIGGSWYEISEGIVWATDNGANVINLSLGGTELSYSLKAAIKYANDNGVTVVAAMGNEASDVVNYPAGYPGVIAVGATDINDNLADFSSYGPHISVSAPGVGILSTYSDYYYAISDTYKTLNGTSMAAPLVSGLAALIKSANPDMNPSQIKQAIEGSTVDLGTPGFDNYFGHGRVDAGETFSNLNRTIVFSSNRDGNNEIYSMNQVGGKISRLTNNSFSDISPSVNGSNIIFSSDRNGNMEIYKMNLNGSNPVRLTNHSSTDNSPSFSPLADKIVFVSSRNGNKEIYSMNSDGTGLLRLTNNTATDDFPCWSPDGTKIVFTTTRDGGNGEIYIMNADGSNQTRLTNSFRNDTFPSWSPDGTKILFSSNRVSSTNYEIYTMNADGTGTTRLTTDPGTDSNPVWTSFGSKVIFTSNRDGDEEIYSMSSSNGGNIKKITDNSFVDSSPSTKSDSPTPIVSYPESDHPYASNTDQTKIYTKSGASQLLVTFSLDTYVEQGYDYIYVMDKNDNLVGSSPYTGSTLAGQTLVVPGDTVKIRLTSDDLSQHYGYKVSNIQY